MRTRVLVLALVALSLGACLDPLELPYGRFGTISVRTFDDGAAGFLASPDAGFYDNSDLTYVPFVGDTCFVLQYTATPSTSGGGLAQTLDAGEYLITGVSGRVDSLEKIPNIAAILYRAVRPFGFPFVPGDTMTVTIPGAAGGFPAGTIRVKTAEAFTHSAVGVPAENADIALTWTAPQSSGSQLTFSLRYANVFSTGVLNEQAFCSFNDDGAGTIPSRFLDGWRNALQDVREVRAVRIRASEIQIDNRSRVSLISTYGMPLPEIDIP